MIRNLTVKADRSACQGYGNCVMKAPGYFDIDDDGLVFLRRQGADPGAVRQTAAVDPQDRRTVEDAVASCPVSALSLEEIAP